MVQKTLRKIVLFLLAIGICLCAAYVASSYMTPAIPAWYDHLQKPDFSPPSWIFGPVWTVLYVIMGLSLYMILQAGTRKKEAFLGLVFFVAQLAFSIAWAYLFYGLHSTFFGLMTLIALWFLILCTVIQVMRFSVPAAAILIPYFLWVTFLVILSYFVLSMNPISYVLF